MNDTDLRKFYEERLDLFTHPGWLELETDLSDLLEIKNRVDDIDDVADFYHRQGQVGMIKYFLALKEQTQQMLEELDNA